MKRNKLLVQSGWSSNELCQVGKKSGTGSVIPFIPHPQSDRSKELEGSSVVARGQTQRGGTHKMPQGSSFGVKRRIVFKLCCA